jgi:1-deoxy-D-xylulose-5-phosphate synthase
MLKKIKDLEGPILIHAITQKGKGYSIAEQLPEKFHGVSPFDIETGLAKMQDEVLAKEEEESICKKGPACTSVFSEALVDIARTNHRVAAITAAMPEGTGLDCFAREFPERFFNVGMAEEHAVGFAAGLAKGGIVPVVAIYSTFLQRSYDQIIHDVCLQGFHVVFALDRAGLVGEDGPTHHGVFDIGYLRMVPNMVCIAPKDSRELEDSLEFALSHNFPCSIRYPKGEAYSLGYDEKISLGKSQVISQGKDVCIIALGSMVKNAIDCASLLKEEGISTFLVNARFIKPLDKELLKYIGNNFKVIVTIEEGSLAGGFGSAVAEFFGSENISEKAKLICAGFPDEFITFAKREKLFEIYGLDGYSLSRRIKQVLANEILLQK